MKLDKLQTKQDEKMMMLIMSIYCSPKPDQKLSQWEGEGGRIEVQQSVSYGGSAVIWECISATGVGNLVESDGRL